MKTIKLKNEDLPRFTGGLQGLELDTIKSLARRRFLRMLAPYEADLNLERDALREKYAKKDENGQIKKIDNVIQFTPENQKLANKDWEVLNKVEVEIDISGEEKDVETMRGILKDEQARFITEKKGKFTAPDFEYSATLEDLLMSLNVQNG